MNDLMLMQRGYHRLTRRDGCRLLFLTILVFGGILLLTCRTQTTAAIREAHTRLASTITRVSNYLADREVPECYLNEQTGDVHFRGLFSALKARFAKNTACRHTFFSTPFDTDQEVRVFLTADRTNSMADMEGTPVVWTRNVNRLGFIACIHYPVTSRKGPGFVRESAVSYMAISNRMAKMSDKSLQIVSKQYRLFAEPSLIGKAIVRSNECLTLPPNINLNKMSILRTAEAPRDTKKYKWFESMAIESAHDSIVHEDLGREYKLCSKQLATMNENRTQSFATVHYAVFKRNKRFSGQTKLSLQESRDCKWIQFNNNFNKMPGNPMNSMRPPRVFLTPRLHPNDSSFDKPTHMSVWVERRSFNGFAVCGQLLSSSKRVKNSVFVHWTAIPENKGGHGCSKMLKTPYLREQVKNKLWFFPW